VLDAPVVDVTLECPSSLPLLPNDVIAVDASEDIVTWLLESPPLVREEGVTEVGTVLKSSEGIE
jgi:hypothetical protein